MADNKKYKKSGSNVSKPTTKLIVSCLIGCACLLAVVVLAAILYKGATYLLTDKTAPVVGEGQLESLSKQMADGEQDNNSSSTADKLKSNKGVVSASLGNTKPAFGSNVIEVVEPTDNNASELSNQNANSKTQAAAKQDSVTQNTVTTSTQPNSQANGNIKTNSSNTTSKTTTLKQSTMTEQKPSQAKSNYVARVTPKKPRNLTHETHTPTNEKINEQKQQVKHKQSHNYAPVDLDTRNIDPAGPKFATVSPNTSANKKPVQAVQEPTQKPISKPYTFRSIEQSYRALIRFQSQLLASSEDTTAIFECTSDTANNAIVNVQNTSAGYTLKFYRSDNNDNISLQIQQPTQDAYFMEHINGYEILMKQKGYWYQFIQFSAPTEDIDATFSQYSAKSSRLIDRFYCVEESMIQFDKMIPQEYNFMPKNDELIKVMQNFQ